MRVSDDTRVCAYCGKATLAGTEEPEHAIPAAINGRFTTRSVCVPCNRWAGQEIDQPWLNDPFVLDVRFEARIPDRRGKLLQRSPLLAGVTEDGRRIELGPDGIPELRNSVVRRDPETGEVHIVAPDQETLDKLVDRERKKAEADGKTFTAGAQGAMSERPQVSGTAMVSPGRWERMAAKAALALLAEARPAGWRRSLSAELLRTRMRDAKRAVSEVPLVSSDAVEAFAASPASAINVLTVGGHPILNVSLVGILTIRFALAGDLKGADLAWVSDPLDPRRSFSGTLGEVVYERHRARSGTSDGRVPLESAAAHDFLALFWRAEPPRTPSL